MHMKKIIIGSIVGGLIIFIWQFLSWTLLELHRPAHQYTPKQTEILNFLSRQFPDDGGYFLPNYPPGSSREEIEAGMAQGAGKPWAVISYHKAMNANMGMNMFRGLVVDILIVALFCWLVSKMPGARFHTILLASLATGFIVFLNVPYTMHIWYETFDLYADLADALVAWGLTGLWLGWWLTRQVRA